MSALMKYPDFTKQTSCELNKSEIVEHTDAPKFLTSLFMTKTSNMKGVVVAAAVKKNCSLIMT